MIISHDERYTMDFVWAVLYPLRGKRWYLRLPVLTLQLMIPILGIVMGFGYVIAIIRNIVQGDYELPGYSHYLKEGAFVLGNAVIHTLVWLVISVVLLFLAGNPRALQSVHHIVINIVAFVVALHFFIGGIRYALTDNPNTMIQIRQNMLLLYQNKWRVMQSLINAILYGCAIAGVMVIVLVGVFSLMNGGGDLEDMNLFQFAIWMAIFS
jgi:hypothetical protein